MPQDIVLHTGSRDSFLEGDAIRVQEDPPSWGLDLIDQVSPVLDGKYYYRNTGRGVTVFIFDNGIRATHQEFAGGQRKVVACGFNAWEAEGDPCHDEFGHGTHVAGTVRIKKKKPCMGCFI
jgi:subtilisin family serine protease